MNKNNEFSLLNLMSFLEGMKRLINVIYEQISRLCNLFINSQQALLTFHMYNCNECRRHWQVVPLIIPK